MKRRSWWLMLFAPQALAQDKPITAEQLDQRTMGVIVKIVNTLADRVLALEARSKWKPVNNQCPVCGTMTTPFTIPKADKCYTYSSNMPSSFTWSGTDLPACPPDWTLVSRQYRQNITRCAHCNVAFWQDAEAANG